MKKFRVFLLVLLLALVSSTASAQSYPRGDVDQDGSVGISDVSALIDYLLNGTWPDETDEHEWVDLGLPSGTLWATCNVGANAPEEYGDYFAWGETEPKDVYSWETYKWCNGSDTTLTKYCTKSKYGYNGFVDNKTELDPEDDAAYVNWGASWRMPTKSQLGELRSECTWLWSNLNGVNGILVTGPNGNSIFLPANGCRTGSSLILSNVGNYWSLNLYIYGGIDAYDFYFWSDGFWGVNPHTREGGRAVRAVYVSQD